MGNTYLKAAASRWDLRKLDAPEVMEASCCFMAYFLQLKGFLEFHRHVKLIGYWWGIPTIQQNDRHDIDPRIRSREGQRVILFRFTRLVQFFKVPYPLAGRII